MKKRAMITASVLFLTAFYGTFYSAAETNAAETRVINLNETDTFKGRTVKAVSEKLSELESVIEKTGYTDGDRSTYYEEAASVSAPYSQGKLKQGTLDTMQAATEFLRWLMGSAELTEKCVPDESLQYQALDRNFEFNHFISDESKPEDMPQELWDMGADCNHNVLAYNYTPLGSVIGWVNEGYYRGSWDTLGHRYLTMDPYISEIQYGYAGRISIGSAESWNNRANVTSEYYIFPSPGAFPSDFIFPYESAWSFDFSDCGPDQFILAEDDKVVVTITNSDSGEKFVRSEEDDTLRFSSQYYGNGIAFAQPDDAQWDYTDTYHVEIEGFSLLEDEETVSVKFVYDVEFFTEDDTEEDPEDDIPDEPPVTDNTDDNEIPADINNDGAVNLADLTGLIRFILNPENSVPVTAKSDLNNDGYIDSKDMVILSKIFLK